MERNKKQIYIEIQNKNDWHFVDEFNSTVKWLKNEFAPEITKQLKERKWLEPKGRISFRFDGFEKGSILAVFTTILVGVAINVASQLIYDFVRRKLDDRKKRRG